MFSSISEVLQELRLGRAIILVDDEERENEGDIVFAAQHASYSLVEQMVNEARGLICTPMTREIAKKLEFPLMVEENTEVYRTAFTVSVDAVRGTTTGISVGDRLQTILQLGNVHSTPKDFRRPGHLFPLIGQDGGVLERKGHTEGSLDLLKLSGLYPVAVICEILNPDGTMARLHKDIIPLAKKWGMKICSIEQIVDYRNTEETPLVLQAEATLPTEFGIFRIHVFSDPWGGSEHVALSLGDISGKEGVLVRIHSSCLTGDVFHSLKCDCGDQLLGAMRMIGERGEGLIIYLSQEGRGIGLVNKIKAYALQETGLDTVASNEALGFAPDLRNYAPAVQILCNFHIKSVDIITNNPEKMEKLESSGISIHDRVPSVVPPRSQRKGYLKTKKEKMRHFL